MECPQWAESGHQQRGLADQSFDESTHHLIEVRMDAFATKIQFQPEGFVTEFFGRKLLLRLTAASWSSRLAAASMVVLPASVPATSAPTQGAHDPFVGKWRLDVSRSTIVDAMRVEAVGPNKYRFSFEGAPAETIVADGTDQPGLSGTTLSVEAVDARKRSPSQPSLRGPSIRHRPYANELGGSPVGLFAPCPTHVELEPAWKRAA